ncbi:MAG: YabP/YqfC family sporulation protein [Lachnospiraceae bacterium]|nr:YabP/YqfC family sporulation protein [Lachnospiraceae bacterium]
MGHKIILSGRTAGIITGVTDIEEFDNDTIDLTTTLGRMVIKGRDLKVKGLNLETGEAQIEGNVDSLVYTSKNNRDSFLKRLFQ